MMAFGPRRLRRIQPYKLESQSL